MPITVTRDGPEAIEDAIAATLRSNINAYIDAVWASWATSDTNAGISVPKVYPVQVVSGRRTMQPQFPAYIVRSIDGRTEEDAAPNFGYMAHRFEVIVLNQSSDEHVLDVQVKRHLTAIRKCLGTHETLDGSVPGILGCVPQHWGKSETVKNEKHLMEQIGAWLCEVRVEEVYM